MEIKTTVFEKSPARFDMAGQYLGHDLKEIPDEVISQGLAKRLVKYARDSLHGSGFNVSGWEIEVETTDASEPPSDRTYHVTFYNEEGGSMGVQGILVSRYGWPCLDHGLFINR